MIVKSKNIAKFVKLLKTNLRIPSDLSYHIYNIINDKVFTNLSDTRAIKGSFSSIIYIISKCFNNIIFYQ